MSHLNIVIQYVGTLSINLKFRIIWRRTKRLLVETRQIRKMPIDVIIAPGRSGDERGTKEEPNTTL